MSSRGNSRGNHRGGSRGGLRGGTRGGHGSTNPPRSPSQISSDGQTSVGPQLNSSRNFNNSANGPLNGASAPFNPSSGVTGFDPRSRKLHGAFMNFIEGKTTINNLRSAKLFIEAVVDRSDPVSCAEKILGHPEGVAALKNSIRTDLSPEFMNTSLSSLLRYLQSSTLKTVCGGDYLRRILDCLADTSFWNAFLQAHKLRRLDQETTQCFAWLLLQLISLPSSVSTLHQDAAKDSDVMNTIIQANKVETRALGERIKHVIEATASPLFPVSSCEQDAPGGRHDNDCLDFRRINITPTADEVLCTQEPFLRFASEIEQCSEDLRSSMYNDNLFRLYREDLLREVREDLQVATGKKMSKRKAGIISGLQLIGVSCTDGGKPHSWTFQLGCAKDLPVFQSLDQRQRLAYLKDNFNFLKHQSLACLLVNGELAALVTINRNKDLLAASPSIVSVNVPGDDNIGRALMKMRGTVNLSLVQLNTALFAYEPVLRRLQELRGIPLDEEILFWKPDKVIKAPASFSVPSIEDVVESLTDDPTGDLQDVLSLKMRTNLDESQAKCLVSSLKQRVSLIQGPPGTGKSFIGALAAKILHDFTKKTILVVTYTNHALDQFTEDIRNIGIPSASIVRLGSATKADANAQALLLSSQAKNGAGVYRMGRDAWDIVDQSKTEAAVEAKQLHSIMERLLWKKINARDLLDHIEFQPNDDEYFEAFTVPAETDGMSRVGRDGKSVGETYLIDRWLSGLGVGVYVDMEIAFPRVWSMSSPDRAALVQRWTEEILRDQISDFCATGKRHDNLLHDVDVQFGRRDTEIIRSKRIIACTTTAAAKYAGAIQAASPDILLVEEAGEILESHIITAMNPELEQLILIGDHKQLRPKANYDLSVEKGNGYDLNRSLFERLVLKGFPHNTLSQQHRMRPEISDLVRTLTYPDLVDAPKTAGRPDLRGFTDNLIFVNHEHLEDEVKEESDWKAMTSKAPKRNTFEAEMVLKCVRYLGQQGYGTDSLVVLTPYLGQLHLLLHVLGKENDPVLNDLDSYDLVQAGLMPAETARLSKKRISISTIDNYQGQESDIVIISLTRSNAANDIGFMISPERLNVLLSRARNAMILVGNAATFLNSRKGHDLWSRFMDLLAKGAHIYDGFPVKCEQHPKTTTIIRSPHDFEVECPDGGCTEPCGTMLSCGIHECSSKCHQLSDHSKMPCKFVLDTKCPDGHSQTYLCHEKKPTNCRTCERELQKQERKRKKDHELQQKREAEQRKHDAELARLEEELQQVRELRADQQRAAELKAALEQKKKDIELARALTQMSLVSSQAQQISTTPIAAASQPSGAVPSAPQPSNTASPTPQQSSTTTPASQSPRVVSPTPKTQPAATAKSNTPEVMELSQSEQEWNRQKRVDGASNSALDDLMKMTGLEEVKFQVLRIKAKIETAQRQDTDLKKERFGVMLLGNPGTGKTTVARIYARFLTSIGILPGSEFVETSGSKLANEGVAGARKIVEDMLKAGGGAFFLDEAYQLTEGQNFGGKPVLDYLLAEIENQTGKICFILAGYNKQMESFFEHNPGFASRIPYSLQFADYSDKELLRMFVAMLSRKYSDRMKVEDGPAGLYTRIVIRRLGRGRGREGFGNARALENILAKLGERQADRLQRGRVAGKSPDDFVLLKEDLIGPEPSGAAANSTAWKQIQSLIGLKSVKSSIQSMIDRIKTNYLRELQEKEPIQVSLNKVFLGSPGTGKTSVGKLYGQVLVDLGMLSSSEVVVKNPSDFTGSHLGESEKNTRAILAASKGKVLIIDEAYMLSSSGGVGSFVDPYKTAVVDTIVAEVQSTPGEDRCVLLLGYEAQMKEMFEHTNPGLPRRFPLDDAFVFEDFDDEQLGHIFDLKLKQQDLESTAEAKTVAIGILSLAKRRPNFGNGGEVENLISRAKVAQQQRESSKPIDERSFDVVFEPQDFDADYDRASRASGNVKELFKDVVGCDSIVAQLEGYQKQAATMRKRGIDPEGNIPFNFVFKGPPGTGKTTTARKIGQVFYDMGFLAKPEVIECSANDLVGQYVGHTGPKTTALLRKCLGKVLFVDEAYRLSEGHFATEAVNELVDCITKPEFANKLIIILAGYDSDMNKLMNVNRGLSSRFPAEVIFTNMEPTHCYQLLKQSLAKSKITCDDGFGVAEVLQLFAELSKLSSWGNGRDVNTVAKEITATIYEAADDVEDELTVSSEQIVKVLRSMFSGRQQRESAGKPHSSDSSRSGLPRQGPPDPGSSSPNIATRTGPKKPSKRNNQEPSTDPGAERFTDSERDPDVSDEVWEQVQRAKAAQAKLEESINRAVQDRVDAAEKAAEVEKAEEERVKLLEEQIEKARLEQQANEAKIRHEEERLNRAIAQRARDQAEAEVEAKKAEAERRRRLLEMQITKARLERQANEAKRRHEAARLERIKAQRAREKAETELENARKAAEAARKKEAQVQQRLREIGVCVAGYRWVKLPGGYRCAGGFHWVTDAQVGL